MKTWVIASLITAWVLIGGVAGYGVGNGDRSTSTTTIYSTSTSFATIGTQTTSQTTSTQASSKNIGTLFVNGTSDINGSNLLGTFDVEYPNSAISGNLNAPTANATIRLDCNDSLFTINADNRVIVNLTIIGDGNTVNMDGARLNMTVDGNLNK